MDYWRFEGAEKRLLSRGIYPSDYATGISKYLKEWVYSKGWSVVPRNVFCGEWALMIYTTEVAPIKFWETSEEVMEIGMLLYSELLVARYYIGQEGKMTFDEVVETIRPMLGDNWLEAYKNDKRDNVISEALRVLSMENDGAIESYDDLL